MTPKRTRREVRGAIIGMVMGDGSLYRGRLRNGDPSGHYLMSISHNGQYREYLEHKTKIVNELFGYPLKVRDRVIRNQTGKTFPVVRMDTRTSPRLTFIARRCYVDGAKRITPWVIENVSIEGLAYWWMDDGHLRIRPPHGGELMLGTYGFPRVDVERLQQCLAARFDIHFGIGRNRKMNDRNPDYGFYLRRGLSHGLKFLDLIAPYAHPSMRHKFDYRAGFTTHCPYRVKPAIGTAPAPSNRG